MEELDPFDFAILRILQENNMTPQREIGEAVGLSAAAVQRRIKRMRQSGVIEADRSVINRGRVGAMVTLIVEVFMDSEKIEFIDHTRNTFEIAPEVQQCYYVTGESDFVLVILTESMQAYEKLTRRIFFSNPNIRHFRTIVAMDVIKAGMTIPEGFLKKK
ncbi:AsnC family transcriptional regulator [Dyadobacter luteus]|uniref:AsnC family transcriptional regulator n=1 Tax=Dyadobacter luteus TaxID=2259619 RepID=A0A3D8Y4I9_9BACT|nr:Lrp/AsnC family transcriptional regulator [Dyadobacter luteus]REA57155.1 AsnC family transcriptional regulator [Dyadobacter luteus]